MSNSKKIAIVAFPALGDITICMRLAQTLTLDGHNITLFADSFTSCQPYFGWLTIQKLPESIEAFSTDFDLMMVDVLAPWVKRHLEHLLKIPNVLLFTAKDYPKELAAARPLASEFKVDYGWKLINRAICLDSNSEKCMIEWGDDYVKEVFGVEAETTRPPLTLNKSTVQHLNTVVIFPTTPNPKKNFSSSGFYRIAKRLSADGLKVEIVVMPHEKKEFQDEFQGFNVKAFTDVALLLDYLNVKAMVVVSNDSGGGHLAAMLGIPTVTITRKNKKFVWRPGYGLGNVVNPRMTLKFGGGHIWRPFISLNQITKMVRKYLIS